MAKIEDSLKILMRLEFNNSSNALHQNPTEPVYTYMGIYQKAHPKWEGWRIIKESIARLGNIKLASIELYKNKDLLSSVEWFYKKIFWDVARLDEINIQHTANEIFIFGVNAGMPTAIKAAQRLVGLQANGKMGDETVFVLNNFKPEVFDSSYDILEQEHYDSLIKKNFKLKIYATGWRTRALAV